MQHKLDWHIVYVSLNWTEHWWASSVGSRAHHAHCSPVKTVDDGMARDLDGQTNASVDKVPTVRQAVNGDMMVTPHERLKQKQKNPRHESQDVD